MSDKNKRKVDVNIIILSDRLIDQAKELSDYIRSCTCSMNVLGIATNIHDENDKEVPKITISLESKEPDKVWPDTLRKFIRSVFK